MQCAIEVWVDACGLDAAGQRLSVGLWHVFLELVTLVRDARR